MKAQSLLKANMASILEWMMNWICRETESLRKTVDGC